MDTVPKKVHIPPKTKQNKTVDASSCGIYLLMTWLNFSPGTSKNVMKKYLLRKF